MSRRAQIVICGAGIAGVSAAYQLASAGFRDILILDPRPPLSLTSSVSTEGYRNWWPDPEITALTNRSIDLLEALARESGNVFRLNRRGYLYVTAEEARLQRFLQRAAGIAAAGGGELRQHHGSDASYRPDAPGLDVGGADLLLEPALIRKHFPYLTVRTIAALHVRRAGWLSAQQLGTYLLDSARQKGVQLEAREVQGIEQRGGRVQGILLSSGERVECEVFVNAAGPFLRDVGRLLDVDIAVRTELHLKVSFKDHLGVLPRGAPMVIYEDEQILPWSDEERRELEQQAETRWLTERFPAGVHCRPDGASENQTVLMLWDYAAKEMDPIFPTPAADELYPEIVLRGLSTVIPGFGQYFDRSPRPYIDGGYYVRTPENRLLAGPLPLEGAYVIGGLSGYGIMASLAAAELLAAHVSRAPLPAYAASFALDRYSHEDYRRNLAKLDTSGQL